jgi:tetratricopeptide (TPR) repeat protein
MGNMKMKPLTLLAATILLVACGPTAPAQDVSLAKDLYLHGISSRALESFIEILHNPKATASDKAESLYYMGQISFDQNAYATALKDWQVLIKDYPSSQRASELKSRLSQLREVFSKTTDASLDSLVASSYLNNGDFWSRGNSHIFNIDSSWLPNAELAIIWYDRVIQEFPGSTAAELAYNRKLFALIGWTEPGQYGSSYGLKADYKKYMPQLLDAFTAFETAFPASGALQGFRYQIAQAYWSKKDWVNTRVWLDKIVEVGGTQPSFYVEAAKARLTKVEY